MDDAVVIALLGLFLMGGTFLLKLVEFILRHGGKDRETKDKEKGQQS
jgi:hypothetical protein